MRKLKIISISNNLAYCECSCGNKKHIKYNLILSNKSKSCGQCPRSNLQSLRFGKLTVLNYDFQERKWTCQCDCGKIIFALSKSLKNNNTKSCGCSRLKSRPSKKDFSKKVYRDRYSDGDLSYNDFLILSQQNCSYCKSPPSNKTKDFIYNGLDRIDSNFPHNLNNVMPCCKLCNRFKSSLSIQDFYTWLKSIDSYNSNNTINLNKHQIFSLKKVWICQYNKELPFDNFVYLSQQDCSYCGREPSNLVNRNKYKKVCDEIKNNSIVKYSTLDRIDNTKDHNLDNVKPACTHCNRSRNNLTIDDFYFHVNKIKIFLKI